MGARVVRGCALLFRGLLSLFGDCFLLFGDRFLCSGNVVFVCPEELPGILVGGVFVHGVFAVMLFLSGVYCF